VSFNGQLGEWGMVSDVFEWQHGETSRVLVAGVSQQQMPASFKTQWSAGIAPVRTASATRHVENTRFILVPLSASTPICNTQFTVFRNSTL